MMNIPDQGGTVVNHPYQAEMTAIQVAYRNEDDALIAPLIAPYLDVSSRTFVYGIHRLGTFFEMPEDIEVVRFGATKEIRGEITEYPGSVRDYALQYPIDRTSRFEPNPNFDEYAHSVELLNQAHDLQFEHQVAQMAKDITKYPAENQVTLSGAAMFSDPASDPITSIQAAQLDQLVPYNTMIIDPIGKFYLERHPRVVKLIYGDANTSQLVRMTDIEAILGLTIKIGKASIDISAPAPVRKPQFVRPWANDLILAHIVPVVTSTRQFTWMATPQMGGGRLMLPFHDISRGPEGSDITRVIHYRQPHLMAPHAAFIFKNAFPTRHSLF